MDKSKEALVIEHMNLVYSVIHKLFPKYIHDEDIVQIGRLGLCEAAERWDESKSQFTTYAWTVIANHIRMEFRRRNADKKTCSLSNPIVSDGESDILTYEDVIQGDDDVAFCDEDGYYAILTARERALADQLRIGKTVPEVAVMWGYSEETIYTIRRKIILKWRKMNEN